MWRFLKKNHSENSDGINDEESHAPDQFRYANSLTTSRKKIRLYDEVIYQWASHEQVTQTV